MISRIVFVILSVRLGSFVVFLKFHESTKISSNTPQQLPCKPHHFMPCSLIMHGSTGTYLANLVAWCCVPNPDQSESASRLISARDTRGGNNLKRRQTREILGPAALPNEQRARSNNATPSAHNRREVSPGSRLQNYTTAHFSHMCGTWLWICGQGTNSSVQATLMKMTPRILVLLHSPPVPQMFI
jgi:hypothetical protein